MKSQQGLQFPVILRLNLPFWNILPVAGFCWMKTKKKHNLKGESYVLFGGLSEDSSQEDSLSDSSEGLFQKGRGGARVHRSFCNKNQIVGTSKDYC